MDPAQLEFIEEVNHSSDHVIFVKRVGREGIDLPLHSHSKYQVIYTVSGTLHIQVGSTNYFVPEQHIAWIPTNTEHILSSNNRQVSLLVFYCTLDLPQEDSRRQFSIHNTNGVILENIHLLSSYGSKIWLSEQEDLYNYAISFFRLLPLMNQNFNLLSQALIIPHDIRLRPVLRYIAEHAKENLSMDHVAHQFGFSVRNLSRLMANSGISFSSFLSYQRITRAIEMLADGNKTMQQIAYFRRQASLWLS